MDICSFGSLSLVGCVYVCIVNVNVLEFKFTGALLGLFLLLLFVYSSQSSLKLPTPLLSYVVLLWNMHGCTPHLFPSILKGSECSEGVSCAAVFPDCIFISLPVVASIFTVELYAIFLAFSCIYFHETNNFVIYSDSRSALQALRSLYTHSPLVLKI